MTSKSLIISVSGVRGIVGDGLTPHVVAQFAAAFGAHVGPGAVLLSRDSRPSGDMLADAAAAGLRSMGCTVLDAGILPTPTAGLAVRARDFAGGIQITASHNPAPWNGLKLFGPDGAVLSAEVGQRVKAIYEAGNFEPAVWNQIGRRGKIHGVEKAHIERVLTIVDVDRIRARQFAIVLDGNGGAGGPAGLMLLNALGCSVTCLGCEPDGHFDHEPEPTPANLPAVAEQAREVGAPAFCLDPDSDRLALIDETGVCLSEELTLALAVQFRLGQQRGPVVVNMSTSRVIADLCQRFDVPFQRTKVGEANVVAGMRTMSAVIGGEGNGGVIDPRIGWVRDPFVGMAMILNLMAESGKPLGRLAAELPQYVIVKEKMSLAPDRLPAALAALERSFPDAAADRLDGLRLDWPNRWLHFRGSNTEPVVRLIAEAPTEAAAQKLLAQARQSIGEPRA
jgi:phosphomannomutase